MATHKTANVPTKPSAGFEMPARGGTVLIEDLRQSQRSLAGAMHDSLSHGPPALRETSFQEGHQATGIPHRVVSLGNHDIIASHFTFDRKLAFNPPDSGMKEEDGAHKLLSKVGPIIPTLEVGKLMAQDDGEIAGWKVATAPTMGSTIIGSQMPRAAGTLTRSEVAKVTRREANDFVACKSSSVLRTSGSKSVGSTGDGGFPELAKMKDTHGDSRDTNWLR